LAQDGVYQIGYAANLNIGDSVVDVSNDGAQGGFNPNPLGAGNLGVNVYTFDPQEEMISCCCCVITPNGLYSLSVKSDLINNTLTPVTPNSVTIALIGSTPLANAAGALTICDATGVNLPPPMGGGGGITTGAVPAGDPPTAIGLLAWGTTLEPASSPGTYGPVPVSYINGTLSMPQINAMTQVCEFIQSNGSGFGVCNSCRLGALGGGKR
jgi:hypothetical protein